MSESCWKQQKTKEKRGNTTAQCLADFWQHIVSEMTYCVSSGTLNPTHSLTLATHYMLLVVLMSSKELQTKIAAVCYKPAVPT